MLPFCCSHLSLRFFFFSSLALLDFSDFSDFSATCLAWGLGFFSPDLGGPRWIFEPFQAGCRRPLSLTLIVVCLGDSTDLGHGCSES